MGATQFEAPQWESLAWLESETVGRLCVIDFDYPLAFPINYRLQQHGDGYRIVFRTVPHSVVGRYNGRASLEVDRIDDSRQNAWSVIVRGELRAAIDETDLPDTSPLLTEGRYRWKVLDVNSISGRRFTSANFADGFSVDWQSVGA
jgi:hypothetical protein